MEQEFITIAEAVRLTGQSDIELMRFLKDRMESGGFDIESITRKEQRGSRMMYIHVRGEPDGDHSVARSNLPQVWLQLDATHNQAPALS